MGKFISYLRVSTGSQQKSGLGIEAQRSSVLAYLNGCSSSMLKEFVEIESGRKNDRPKLYEALQLCKMTGATLLISKLDRLGRDAAFLLNLQKSQVAFVCCDNPHANELTIGLLAVIAQNEAEMISKRTKEALNAARARGVRLGGTTWSHLAKYGNELAVEAIRVRADAWANDIRPLIKEIQLSGVKSLNGIAKELTARGILTARGKTGWHARSVLNVLARVA